MIGHLGTRVSALLDGQLSAAEEERAWAHVHACHLCRDQVEREGWVKTRLSRLGGEPGGVPEHLKGALLGAGPALPPGDAYLALEPAPHRARRNAGLAAIGGSAVGAAVVGVLALGAAPADAPSPHRPAPVTTQLTTPAAPTGTPARRPEGTMVP